MIPLKTASASSGPVDDPELAHATQLALERGRHFAVDTDFFGPVDERIDENRPHLARESGRLCR
jgi:hypothetical protein